MYLWLQPQTNCGLLPFNNRNRQFCVETDPQKVVSDCHDQWSHRFPRMFQVVNSNACSLDSLRYKLCVSVSRVDACSNGLRRIFSTIWQNREFGCRIYVSGFRSSPSNLLPDWDPFYPSVGFWVPSRSHWKSSKPHGPPHTYPVHMCFSRNHLHLRSATHKLVGWKGSSWRTFRVLSSLLAIVETGKNKV